MPLDLAEAICASEAPPPAVLVLVFLEGDDMEFEGAAIELAGAGAGADAVLLAGAGFEAGEDAAGAPESVSAFLLLRVRLVFAAVASLLDGVLFAERSELAVAAALESLFLLFFLDFLAGLDKVSEEAAVWSSAALAALFAFFFFFLVVVVEGWSSGELAWNLAKAEIPDRTNSRQSAIVHVLSLVCSLLMISSLVPKLPGWAGATIMTLHLIGVNLK
jgi:hypothetical protein